MLVHSLGPMAPLLSAAGLLQTLISWSRPIFIAFHYLRGFSKRIWLLDVSVHSWQGIFGYLLRRWMHYTRMARKNLFCLPPVALYVHSALLSNLLSILSNSLKIFVCHPKFHVVKSVTNNLGICLNFYRLS